MGLVTNQILPFMGQPETAPESSHGLVERAPRTQVVPTRRRKPVVSPASAAEAHPARGQLPDFSRPIPGARPETPDVEKVPLSEITQVKVPASASEQLAALGGRSLEVCMPSSEQRLKARRLLAKEQYAAKRDGKCPAVVKERKTSWASEPKKRCCGAVATRKGLCRRHYNKKILRIRTNQAGGEWGNTRHFADWQLPGSMTDIQHECLAALPLYKTYEDCIEAMNGVDPTNILLPIYEKPASRKSKR